MNALIRSVLKMKNRLYRLYWFKHPFWGLRNFIQRGKRGWSDRDVWSLDTYLAQVIAESVTKLKETNHGHPGDLEYEEWLAILDNIVFAFTVLQDVPWLPDVWEPRFAEYPFDMPKETYERIKKGQALFIEWFQALWD